MLLRGDLVHTDVIIEFDTDGDLIIERDDCSIPIYLSPAQWQILREFLSVPKRVEETS